MHSNKVYIDSQVGFVIQVRIRLVVSHRESSEGWIFSLSVCVLTRHIVTGGLCFLDLYRVFCHTENRGAEGEGASPKIHTGILFTLRIGRPRAGSFRVWLPQDSLEGCFHIENRVFPCVSPPSFIWGLVSH